jgi:biopolymer transport protein ExbB/biopolymer transport protein TolQ
MDKVMGGIAEALIATGVGLFVAIPAVVAYNIFQKRIGNIEDNVSSITKRLSAFISAGRHDSLRPSDPVPNPVKAAGDSVRDLARLASASDSANDVGSAED